VLASPAAPVSIRLDLAATAPIDVYRGETLPDAISGQVLEATSGAGLARVKVQLYLVPDGAGQPVAIGAAVLTDATGRFEARVRLPPTLRLGRYRIVAASDQTAALSAGRSDVQ
jgi:5-hydroxyisourate hydrolase-like protein (transthyretin family)